LAWALGLLHTRALLGSGVWFCRTFWNHEEVHFVFDF
jgi:hypothetical protein